MGRTYAGTCVIRLVQDLQTRVINAATGELLRDPTLDPSRDYQPTGASKGPCCKTPKLPVPGLGQPTHGRVAGGGRAAFEPAHEDPRPPHPGRCPLRCAT